MVARFILAIDPGQGMSFPSPQLRHFSSLAAYLLVATGFASGCRLTTTSLTPCALRNQSPDAAHLLEESRQRQFAADGLADSNDDRCVDAYFSAIHSAWRAAMTAESEADSTELRTAASAQYHAGLRRLLYSGQKFGRLDPRSGLQLSQGEAKATVPIVHCGFSWPPDSFQRILLPPQELPKLLACKHARPGGGVPLVVNRCRNPSDPSELRFFPPQSSFAATALLRFSEGTRACPSADSVGWAVLEFHDPIRVAKVSLPDGELPLAGDLTAPLAETLRNNPSTYLAGFIQPGAKEDEARLNFLEPYQKGKPPVVFIHGLLSDPQGWADMVNDLRALPGFCERYQVWFYRYPTGQGFLRSAAGLRQELQAAIQTCDPQGADAALQEMVLVGHSMGGLVAKLQVTHSDDAIWRRLANRPLEEINTDEATRQQLSGACFFEPIPQVRRVIFIATPHCGSNNASGLVGDLASRLVRESPQEAQQHRLLMEQNPGVFADAVRKRFPTSIDMLQQDSILLDAMREMRIGNGVHLHTIVGVASRPSLHGPSDGVVLVSSARHPGSESESVTRTPHAKVHHAPETTREVARILGEHLSRE
jgi:pimeloyl-ACP methyl ester carboxylesterase